MKNLKTTAAEGQFVLKDIVYQITSASLSAYYQNMELVLFPTISAKADDTVEYEMRCVHLYHNNGFHTHTHDFRELKGKKFVWSEEYNAEGEEAGTLCVQEHEPVRKGTIEILNAENGQLTIQWSGKAYVGWDRKYGDNVPFETIFTVKIPDTRKYCLDAFQSTKMKIDEETQLELLNLEEFNQEVRRVSETRAWDSFNTILKFKLTYENIDYLGEIQFTNGKNNFELHISEDCPKRISFQNVDYNLKVNYEMFTFEIS